MTIEAGPKPNGVRTAAADSRNQKNKPGATDSQNGGFGAVLASVESSEKAEPPATETVDASAEAEVTTAPVVPSTLPDPTSNLPIQPVATDGRELGKDRDAKLLVETSVLGEFDEGKKFLPRDPVNAVAPAMLPVVDSAAMPNVAATDTAALLTQAAQGPAANVQNSQVDVQRSTERTGQSDVAGILARPSTPRPDAAPVAVPSALDVPLEPPGKPGKWQRDFAAQQAQLGDILAAKETLAGKELESRVLPLAQKSIEQPSVPITVSLAAASSMMPTRRDDPNRERSVFRSSGVEGSAFGATFSPTGASAAVQYTPELQMPPEVFVAEKVAYWISNDVQNAEMKLDGIGLDPVEVSIRMHGNEAQVAFRTDELQARAALESASTHLKELLQREGLVLTGVSVGTAGAGDSGDRDGKSRQGARQQSITALVPARADRGVVTGRGTGGTLDLFV